MDKDTSVPVYENIRLINLIRSRNAIQEVTTLLHLLQNNFHYACTKGGTTSGQTFSVSNGVKKFPNSGHDGILLSGTVASLPNEDYTDFRRRSTFLLSSFCNAYVIPVFLLHAIGYARSVGVDWHRLVKISWERVENDVVRGDVNASDFFMHKHTRSNELVDFFLVAGEVLNRYLMQTSSDIHSVTLHILLSEELFRPQSMQFFPEQGLETALALMSQAMQFFPIYRSILARRSSDYGITLAPYNMGVGCGLALPTNKESTTKPEIRAYTFVYGHWAEDVRADTIFMSSRHVYCDMTSLHDIDLKKGDIDPSSIPQILPYACNLLEPAECSSPLLLKALRARKFVFPNTPDIDSNCTLLDIVYNPVRPADSPASSVKQLSAYLILLIASCTNLIGKNARIMAYVSFEKVIGDEPIQVTHVLDIGTSPEAKVSGPSVYKHSGTKSMLCDVAPDIDSQPRSGVPIVSKIPSLQELAASLSSLFSGADENFRRQYYCLTRRSSTRSDIDSYLSANKVKIRIVTQECHPQLLSLMDPQEQQSSSDSELLDVQDCAYMEALQSTMPMTVQEPKKEPVTPYAGLSVADPTDTSVVPISPSRGNIASDDECARLSAARKMPQNEALQKSDLENLPERRVTFDSIEKVHLYDTEHKSSSIRDLMQDWEPRFSLDIIAALGRRKRNLRNAAAPVVPRTGSGRFAHITQPDQESSGDALSTPIRPNTLPLRSQHKAPDVSPASEKRDIKTSPIHKSGASYPQSKRRKCRVTFPVTLATSILAITSALCIVVPLYTLSLKDICSATTAFSPYQCDAYLVIFCALFISLTMSVTALCEYFLFVRHIPIHDNDNYVECGIDSPRSALLQAETVSELGTGQGRATR